MSTNPGWYIDDIRIGEKYTQDELDGKTILQPESSYMKRKAPNGYGILVHRYFCSWRFIVLWTFRDSTTGILSGYRW